MKNTGNVVSIHPYFKVKPGKLEEFKAALQTFIEHTATEEKNLYYDFTISGDVVFCREAYVGADGLLAHVQNVGTLLMHLLTLASVERVEVHGPEAELERLKGPLAQLQPIWFTRLCGVER